LENFHVWFGKLWDIMSKPFRVLPWKSNKLDCESIVRNHFHAPPPQAPLTRNILYECSQIICWKVVPIIFSCPCVEILIGDRIYLLLYASIEDIHFISSTKVTNCTKTAFTPSIPFLNLCSHFPEIKAQYIFPPCMHFCHLKAR
jgi:hypothetical protein